VQIDLNNLKTVISVTKNSERSAAVEKDKLRKDGKKLWNDNINTWINLYYIDFFIVKKLQKIGKNF